MLEVLSNAQIDCMVTQKEWIDIFSALLMPTIAILGIYIAIRQWLTNKNKLKLELFDKRYRVFENIMKFIASILSSGRVEEGAAIHFLRDTKVVAFLFDNKIKKLTDEMYTKANKLAALTRTEKTITEDKLHENLEEQDKIKQWFQEQLDGIDNVFKKYLKLKH